MYVSWMFSCNIGIKYVVNWYSRVTPINHMSYFYRSFLFYYFAQVRFVVSPVLLFGDMFGELFYVLFYPCFIIGWLG
jgi:hypothetical protein